MYQIDVDTVASARPASTALGSTGYFTDGNAATGVAATIVPAEFLNSVMLELMNAITGAGLTLSKSSVNQLYTAIQTIAQGGASNYAADTGAANAYAAAYTPTVAAPVDGMVRAFKVKTANTGASTFALDGSATTYPIYGMGGVALQGGELTVNGIAVVRFNSTLAGWVLLGCGGAPLQVAAGTASKHAATVGQVQSGLSSYAVDTGSANTYVVALSPALSAYTDGVKVRFRAFTANTGASTLNVNGLGAKTLVGGAHSALAGGEIVAGGYCEAEYNSTLGYFVLLECTGAALQVSAGASASQAVNYGQFAASFGASGYQKLPSGIIIQWGSLVSAANGLVQAAFPIAFPVVCVSAVVNYLEAGNGLGGVGQVSSNTTKTIIQANCFSSTTAAAISGGNLFYIAIGY
jgi:hypothetical protein